MEIILYFQSQLGLYNFPKILSRLGNSSRGPRMLIGPDVLMVHLFTQREPGEDPSFASSSLPTPGTHAPRFSSTTGFPGLHLETREQGLHLPLGPSCPSAPGDQEGKTA